ncbi:MAG TPA: DUF2071 domain-containing protein [Vicinamibacterales bacterium]|nr:DUF2071 domain-containing protein [Vicinamibacterales bacterium]
MQDGRFNDTILDETSHRPWPVPSGPWIMTQTWHDLLFAHWPVDPLVLRALVPPSLDLDVYDGRAWVGIVPFRMSHVVPRGVPSLPWVSAFPEMNVRTYVSVGGKPGVYFFSLDATNALAVWTARTIFHLPYYRASMEIVHEEDAIAYRSHRHRSGAAFAGRYAPTSDPRPPTPGTLEYFLTERYCLYTLDGRKRTCRVDIHHPPWPLQSAAAAIAVNTMALAAGVPLPATPPLLHFSRRQDMVCWKLHRV